MFATSRAVGRVVDLSDTGDSRVVTLEPIEITELLHDADLHSDQLIDPSAMAYQVIPDLPGAGSDPDASDAPPLASPASSSTGSSSMAASGSAGDGTVELPPIRLVAAQPGQNLPIVAKGCPEVSVGQWSVKTCMSDRLTVNVDFKTGAGLKLGVGFELLLDHLHVTSGTTISGGKVTSSGGQIEGIKGFELHFLGGA